ncbi:M14 family zinc carboxypeptidase [Lentzea sp. NPDC006480]|uniref:M14 family zinc carboxypeptidase n=1 Tax=Lentzea sp. NPDC006480 TaxID=3157176 RepID=UPI0033B28326
MKRSTTLLSALALVVGGAAASPAQAAPPSDPLDVYVAQVTPKQAGDLSRQGLDVAAARTAGDKVEVELVLDSAQQKDLAKRGIDAKLKKNKDGKTTKQLAAEQAAGGFTVWRSYDEPGGIRDQLYSLAQNNQNLVKLEVLGKTGQGREIIALKVTQGALGQRDGSRPAVLYSSTQHAREWISTEVNHEVRGGVGCGSGNRCRHGTAPDRQRVPGDRHRHHG